MDKVTDKPKFEPQNCTKCQFMGHYDGYDLYAHLGEDCFEQTLVARYGNRGDQYTSGLEFALGYKKGGFQESRSIRALAKCLDLATEAGLYPINKGT